MFEFHVGDIVEVSNSKYEWVTGKRNIIGEGTIKGFYSYGVLIHMNKDTDGVSKVVGYDNIRLVKRNPYFFEEDDCPLDMPLWYDEHFID